MRIAKCKMQNAKCKKQKAKCKMQNVFALLSRLPTSDHDVLDHAEQVEGLNGMSRGLLSLSQAHAVPPVSHLQQGVHYWVHERVSLGDRNLEEVLPCLVRHQGWHLEEEGHDCQLVFRALVHQVHLHREVAAVQGVLRALMKLGFYLKLCFSVCFDFYQYVQGDFFNWPSLVQYQNEKMLANQRLSVHQNCLLQLPWCHCGPSESGAVAGWRLIQDKWSWGTECPWYGLNGNVPWYSTK